MIAATSSAVAVDTHAQTDEDVIRQVLDGDSGMFELLMRRYNERVYRAAPDSAPALRSDAINRAPRTKLVRVFRTFWLSILFSVT